MTFLAGGRGIIQVCHCIFWGSGGGPLPSTCWVLPERPSNHEPWFTSSRPTPCRAPDLAPGPCNPGAPIPAPSPSRSEAKEAVRGPTDSLTDGQTDGRLPMAAPAEPCAGPVWNQTEPAPAAAHLLSLCFLKTAGVWVPPMYLWVLGPIHLLYIHRHDKGYLQMSALFKAKMVLGFALIVLCTSSVSVTLWRIHRGMAQALEFLIYPTVWLTTMVSDTPRPVDCSWLQLFLPWWRVWGRGWGWEWGSLGWGPSLLLPHPLPLATSHLKRPILILSPRASPCS